MYGTVLTLKQYNPGYRSDKMKLSTQTQRCCPNLYAWNGTSALPLDVGIIFLAYIFKNRAKTCKYGTTDANY